ncbi:undecaprenyl-phosphate glucose phosphotransferase [Halomonas sp. Ps84H-12]|uniref:undecaprenyl-phosphate glucose phosphotransferase n=1 Tax=Halomonas sp. Ps84H-12 TaxID=2954501 RepID=UPI0020978DEF|nr:undecaprenyl-phosphate glucose phosphotransferase [Halomonas sp. Ps84H-12]MCO7244543.1 undecaprenyl-phosphate glucose phosphotransferase [Halomonas sp. Ps84H-12]
MKHSNRHLYGFDAYTNTLIRLADLAIIFAGGWLAYLLRFGQTEMSESYGLLMPLGALAALLIFSRLGIYISWRGRVRTVLIMRLLFGYFLVGAVLALILFLFQYGAKYSRLWVIMWISSACLFSIVLRLVAYPILNRVRMSGRNRRSVLLVGDAHSCATAIQHLERHPQAGFDIERILVIGDDEANELQKNRHESYSLGETIEHNEEEVWICLPISRGEDVRRIQASLSLSTGNVRYMPDMRDFRLINHSVSNVADLFLLDLSCSPMSGSARLLKRLEDIVLSSLILILISPLMVILALGVKLSSPGPVFYRQERVGLNGQPFMMLKFRSMPMGVEKNGIQWGGTQKKEVTRFGKLLRKTSLDELPQFINVIKGDMSIVGPRPERTLFVEQFKHEIPGYMQKHMVKAGITGWAQINGWRGDTDLAKRIECDLWYIENWSIWLDLKIILLTIFKGFIHENAV